MTKRMLIDASHPEETRVAVLDGNRLEAFDIESANRLPLKGNIYLARVVRVEPSLQAAFVEYGGNRHGFLAFGEIHPDYYQIPIADRQRLLEAQRAEAEEERRREEAEDAARANDGALNDAIEAAIAEAPAGDEESATEEGGAPLPAAADTTEETPAARIVTLEAEAAEAPVPHEGVPVAESSPLPPEGVRSAASEPAAEPNAEGEDHLPGEAAATEDSPRDTNRAGDGETRSEDSDGGDGEPGLPPETVGGTTEDEMRERRIPPKFLRNYKIQEVIKRRQIMLVQVVKEERGTKGAALTTYISLAGRFSVLMPNSPRGGGVSRKITSTADRKRLREVIDDLALPEGMSLIVRTAGAQRPKPEIRKDCEYLLRLWDGIRERTFASSAPALIYEEADLIKRSIRDTYGKDVEEVLVDGEDAYQEAREFMRMLMPAHANKVRTPRDGIPLFAKHGVDSQLEQMHNPTVQLKSGGYIVINQTEALVAIDVNSGRATRDRHIEDTALRTNLEAADEVARQLRLRDLAGLIVIDFIDMESSKHDGMVERRLKEALKLDRARIQVGRISHFGLLEMSRQRLRPSLVEHAFITCPHCSGRGLVRSVESSGLAVLRAIEEEGAKRRAAEIVVHVATPLAFWLLNRKRERLAMIEERFGMSVLFQADDTLIPPALRIERTRAQNPDAVAERPAALRMDYAPEPEEAEEDEAEPMAEPVGAPAARAEAEPRAEPRADAEGDAQGRGRRRRRRRRGRREGGEALPGEATTEEGEEEDEAEEAEAGATESQAEAVAEAGTDAEAEGEPEAEATDADGAEEARRRRRGRRGGRRRRPDGESGAEAAEGQPAAPPAAPPATPMAAPVAHMPQPRRAPTPADPFAGQMDEILMAMEAAEQQAAERATRSRRAPPPEPVEPAPAASPVEHPAEMAAAPSQVAAPMAELASAPVAAEPPAPEAPMAEAPQAAAPSPAVPVAEIVVAEPPAAALPDQETPPAAPPAPPAGQVPPAEPVIGQPVAPIVLGAEGPAELPRKRGWWRK
ncbi:ribonuclease E/G [Falsiroseomonas sp.]|uniref:ribonuclease E/G n=1 Tax=Falsiroseomonas sp. TaxID=2870721 RepID=UPI003561D569